MATWDDVLGERDRQVYEKGGFGSKKREFGSRPVLVIVDVTYKFVGDKPEPVLKSVGSSPYSCGEEGWEAVHRIASILPLVREKRVPVIYSKGQSSPHVPPWSGRASDAMAGSELDYKFVREISPEPGDYVVTKRAPSIFFGTDILSYLISHHIDTLFFCGGVTSGCVRASVVDATSYLFKVGVIEECTFDRFEISHKVSLFDINAKYGRVISLAEAISYFNNFYA